MSCTVCLEDYDEAEHRPKFLSCGHTFCLRCLIQLHTRGSGTSIRCPQDRTIIPVKDTRLLPDNYSLQSLIAEGQGQLSTPKPKLFWCLDCDRDADPTCVDEHSICSLKKGRSPKMEAKVAALQEGCGVELLSKLLQQLAVVRGAGQPPDAQEAALEKQKQTTEAAIESLNRALDRPGCALDAALESLEAEAAAASQKLPTWQGALRLLSAEHLEVTVGNDSVGKWKGELKLAGGNTSEELFNRLRHLLFSLQMGGHLTKYHQGAGDQQEVEPPCSSTQAPKRDQSTHPITDEDTLDMSRFHKNYNSKSNEPQLQQMLLSKKKVRRLSGLGNHDLDRYNLRSSKALQNIWANVWHCISRAMEVHQYCVEELSLHTCCLAHLHSALGMPRLRKLQILFETRHKCVCPTCTGTSANSNKAVPVSGSIQSVDVRMSHCGSTASAWLSPVLSGGPATTLREVTVSKVSLPMFPEVWTDDWSWLPRALRQCPSLQRVTLIRYVRCPGGPVCAAQLSALRRACGERLAARCNDCHPSAAV